MPSQQAESLGIIDIVVRAIYCASSAVRTSMGVFWRHVSHSVGRGLLSVDSGDFETGSVYAVGAAYDTEEVFVAAQLQGGHHVFLGPARAAFCEFWVAREPAGEAEGPDVDQAGAPSGISLFRGPVAVDVRAQVDGQDEVWLAFVSAEGVLEACTDCPSVQ